MSGTFVVPDIQFMSSWWREHDDKHQIHPDSDNGEKGSAAKASEAGDAVKDESEETVNA